MCTTLYLCTIITINLWILFTYNIDKYYAIVILFEPSNLVIYWYDRHLVPFGMLFIPFF